MNIKLKNKLITQAAAIRVIERANRFAHCVEFLQGYSSYLVQGWRLEQVQILKQSRQELVDTTTAEQMLAVVRRREDRLTALKLRVDFRGEMRNQACSLVQSYADVPTGAMLAMLEASVSFLKDPL